MAFAQSEFDLSERTACKLLGVDRASYRYEAAAGSQRGAANGAGEAGPAEAALRLSAFACGAERGAGSR